MRAIVVGWPEPGRMLSEDRKLLADMVSRSLAEFPPDAEVPLEMGEVPLCAVAAACSQVEETYSVRPWESPPLAGAARVLCLEGPESDRLARWAVAWQEGTASIEGVEVVGLEVRERRYTSASIASVAYEGALPRQPRAVHPHVLLWAFQRTPQWWALSSLQRQALFLPRLDQEGRVVAPGHVEASAELVPVVHRRLYYQVGGEESILAWLETGPEHVEMLGSVARVLQDVSQVPDHAYYQCGPLWWGRRVALEELLGELS